MIILELYSKVKLTKDKYLFWWCIRHRIQGWGYSVDSVECWNGLNYWRYVWVYLGLTTRMDILYNREKMD